MVRLTTSGTVETLPKWIFKNMRLPHAAPIVNVVALGVTLLSLIPVYLAQRLTRETGGAVPGGARERAV